MAEDLPERLDTLTTPCFVVNLDRLQRNCDQMRERCEKLGVKLRPHMKTHKTIEAGEYMTNNTKRCVVVSTVKEAEFFADGGFDDILYAYPFTEDKLDRLAALTERLELFHVLVDSQRGIDLLLGKELPENKSWNVWLKVDCGNCRAGVPWDNRGIVDLARSIDKEERLVFQGVYVHDGNSYLSRDKVTQTGEETADRILQVVELLQEEGVNITNYATGSTPSCSRPGELMGKLTEFHPGCYAFYDTQQVSLGSCRKNDVAGRVATRVVGHYPHRGQILVDCGFLALSHDGKGMLGPSYCYVDRHPNLGLVKMTQECGIIEALDGQIDYDSIPVGSILYLLPYHACATANMHPVYYVHTDKDDRIIAAWRPCRGW